MPVSTDCRRLAAFEEAFSYHRELERLRNRLPFEIDGVVIKVDDLAAAR